MTQQVEEPVAETAEAENVDTIQETRAERERGKVIQARPIVEKLFHAAFDSVRIQQPLSVSSHVVEGLQLSGLRSREQLAVGHAARQTIR